MVIVDFRKAYHTSSSDIPDKKLVLDYSTAKYTSWYLGNTFNVKDNGSQRHQVVFLGSLGNVEMEQHYVFLHLEDGWVDPALLKSGEVLSLTLTLLGLLIAMHWF